MSAKMRYIWTILCYSHLQKWIHAAEVPKCVTETSLVTVKSEKEGSVIVAACMVYS